jgi:CheY-like chemotaxis protein
MPIEDGYTLVEKVRKLPAEHGGAIPAVALTGFAREEDNARALSAGFNKHVAKPIDPENLVSEIAKLIKDFKA